MTTAVNTWTAFRNCLRTARYYERRGHEVQAEYWFARMEVHRAALLRANGGRDD